MGKIKTPLRQVDIKSDNSPHDPFITLTERTDIEYHIMRRNRAHSLQAHATPFLRDQFLSASIDPTQNEKFDAISKGTFINTEASHCSLSPTEREWILSLQRLVSTDIQLHLDINDFKKFFKKKQERMASSPSG